MKTNRIEDCIEALGTYHSFAVEARAELATLREENARLKELLILARNAIHEELCDIDVCIPICEEIGDAALSGGAVNVDTTLRKENARLRQACGIVCQRYCDWYSDGSSDQASDEFYDCVSVIRAALSSEPSGKALVDREKLREMHIIAQAILFPHPDLCRDLKEDAKAMCGWLAALLKEAE